MESNKEKIEALANEMLEQAFPHLKGLVKKALNSGALDIDGWDENSNPMILPKIIVAAVLEEEADQYKATGTSFEKEVRSEIKNLKHFL